MVSVEQIAALIERMEDHPEVALAKANRSKEGRDFAKRFWEETARKLNRVSAQCCTKSSDQWRLYYNEYKSKVLKKVKMEKAQIMDTGGGLLKINLTPLQKRLYTVLKQDVRAALPNVQDPLFHIKVMKSEMTEDAPTVEENIQGADIAQTGSSPEQSPQPDEPEAGCSSGWGLGPHKEEPSSPREEVTHCTVQLEEEPWGSSPQTAPRRRRRVQVDPVEHKRAMREVSEHYRSRASDSCGVREAARRLEALERMSAAAARDHARATNRLAAALESLAERLRDPIVIITQRPSETPNESQDKRSSRQSSPGND